MPISLSTNINKQKQALRQYYQQQVLGDSNKICANAWEILRKETNPAQHHIALYIPIKAEVDCTPLIEKLLLSNYKLCMPVMQSDAMPLLFVPYHPKQTKLYEKNGIKEPKHTNKQIIPTHVCMPAIAFDDEKYRLGYGKGLYDRTINMYRHMGYNTVFYALAFDNRKYSTLLPKGIHDAKLDAIITETSWLK